MLSLLAFLVLSADDRASPDAMYSLTEQELRSRIVGKQIQTTDKPPPGLDYVTTEWFTKDGRYFHFFHGHEAMGTYRFVNDMVCVRTNDREGCRTGLTDSNGDLWLLSKGQDRTRIGRYAITDSNR